MTRTAAPKLAAYAGLEHKELAFGLALILDELARHWRDLDEQLRARLLAGCRSLLGHPAPSSGQEPDRRR